MCCNVLDGGMLTDAGVGGRTSVIGKYGSCFDDDFMLYEFKVSILFMCLFSSKLLVCLLSSIDRRANTQTGATLVPWYADFQVPSDAATPLA